MKYFNILLIANILFISNAYASDNVTLPQGNSEIAFVESVLDNLSKVKVESETAQASSAMSCYFEAKKIVLLSNNLESSIYKKWQDLPNYCQGYEKKKWKQKASQFIEKLVANNNNKIEKEYWKTTNNYMKNMK